MIKHFHVNSWSTHSRAWVTGDQRDGWDKEQMGQFALDNTTTQVDSKNSAESIT